MMDLEKTNFKCKECGKIVIQGKCGEHRVETGHKDFEFFYEDKIDDSTTERRSLQKKNSATLLKKNTNHLRIDV